ncbi:DUF1761 domain-containing protein [Flavobacterium azooxidireducens]|uniref:DUF1761 domain-containing protein n=1 Tax=Flavobacterium azooxidireducens TaxID=1871076 RepID=A0ABY4KKD7_9FLAO|nr:DUF1761 domain-containing protein [Flavobacterium azooxidireducens]UPQ79867.1 DUF1761 domain-containing protein [Flavobacterium azooxidireducens]
MEMNFYPVFVAALTTLLVGFIWYGPLFGKAWMKETGLTEEDLKKGSMVKIFGLTYIFSVMIGMVMQLLTIHQFGALGMIGGPQLVDTALPSYSAFMADYGTAFRTFKHGALHGSMSGLFLAFPLIAINGLFERKSWKYILIHSGYWIVVMTIMGAIVCGWV